MRKHALIGVAFLLISVLYLAVERVHVPIKEIKMNETNFELGLNDASFWDDPFGNEDAVSEKFDFVDDHMIVIGAPGEVDPDKRDSLPLLIYQNGTPKDMYHYNLESVGWIVIVDVERNRLLYGVALPVYIDKIPDKPTTNQSYTMLLTKERDLNDDFELDMRAGKYMTVIIAREYVSNRVATVIKPRCGFYKDKGVDKFIEEERKKRKIPPVWPPFKEKSEKIEDESHLPVYSRYYGSPEVPKGPGIAVNATRVQYARPGAVCLIQGVFRLPSEYGRFIPPDQRKIDGDGLTEYLRVPIHLFITGSVTPLAFSERLMVPVYDEVKKPDEGKLITGYFTFNILEHSDLTRAPQTYFMYLFSGEAMTGPVPIAFVDPKRIGWR